MLGIKYNNVNYVYRKDAQGNIIAILDSSGTVVVKYNYDAWGNHVVSGSNTSLGNANPFRYRGYYYDTETKLYYLQTRYYDPEVGRFINIDNIDYIAPETINGLNFYAYCNNNPVNYYDPSGQFVISIGAVVGLGIAAVGAALLAWIEATFHNNSEEEFSCYFNIIHELTHYFQWYFYEDKEKSNRSLEINANKWANYIILVV